MDKPVIKTPVKKKQAKSYTCRVKIDENMGEIFTWLSGFSPRLRSREVAVLVRVGFELRQFQGKMQPIPYNDVQTYAEPHKQQPEPVDKLVDVEKLGVQTSHAAMQAHGFDLDFLTPSPEGNMH